MTPSDAKTAWRAERSSSRWPVASRSEWAVIALAALLWLPALSARDVWSPDEPRFAQVAEELRAGSVEPGVQGAIASRVVLHLNGVPYAQKPPLYYWLAAAIGAPSGRVEPWAARLPSALAGIAGLALCMAIARRSFGSQGPRAAPWAGLGLLFSFRYAELSQRASLDVLITALELAAVLAWLRFARGEWSSRRAWSALHGALGIAMLVKGPVVLLPLPVIALTAAWNRRDAEVAPLDLRGLFAPCYLALSLGPFALWGAAVLALTPAGFFEAAVVENLFGRFFQGTSHARPFYYYVFQLPLDSLPTALLLPAAARAARRSLSGGGDAASRASWRLLVGWMGVYLVFFSLSAGKRGSYLLPVFPALSIGAAVALLPVLGRRGRLPLRAGAIASALAIAIAGWAASALWGGAAVLPFGLDASDGVAAKFEFPRAFLLACTGLGLAAALAGSVAIAQNWSAARRVGAIAAALAALQLAFAQLLAPALDAERSLRPIADAAEALALPGEAIGVFRHASMSPGVVYYLGGVPGRVVDLQSRAEVDAFLAGRGRVLIAEGSRREALGPPPLPIQRRFRSGSRELWILAPDSRTERLTDERSGGPDS